MKDFQFGDKVIYQDEEFLVLGHIASDNVMIKITNAIRSLYAYPQELKRFPRAGEEILVKDIDGEGCWSKRFFAGFNDEGNALGSNIKLSWDEWKLIEEQDSIDDIVEKIKNNDPEILKAMAEIILATKEKIKED